MIANSVSESLFVRSADGLRLHIRDHRPHVASGLPVLCLPGLARSAEDFDLLATALAGAGRRVVALDYRGRGLSDWDPDWTHYSLEVEGEDIKTALSHLGLTRAVFIGTSRGGLHTMRLAAQSPGLVRAAVLNDIGPTIELVGLMRIKSYVGRLPPLNSLADAVALLRFTSGAAFSAVTPAEWEIFARQTFKETEGKVALRYDPQVSHALDSVAPDMEPLDFWPDFAALAGLPTLAIRGGNSDILSPPILAEMHRRHKGLESFTVEGQGHAPLLLDEPTIGRIVDFVLRAP